MARERPGPLGLVAAGRPARPLLQASPFGTLWDALGRRFGDPRLRQLFGRYATYCGSSPFAAPATLMLVAHVEQEGVWLVEGGMHRLALALAGLARDKGATLRLRRSRSARSSSRAAASRGVRLRDGEEIAAEVVSAMPTSTRSPPGGSGAAAARHAPADPAQSAFALGADLGGRWRETEGFPLQRHNVVFSRRLPRRVRRDLPAGPAAGRADHLCLRAGPRRRRTPARAGPERLLILVNAPPTGDGAPLPTAEIEQCRDSDLRAAGAMRADDRARARC